MEKKLNKGDKVRMRRTVCFDYITFEKDCVGEVSSDEDNKGFCRIRMKNAENGKMTEHFISANNLELIDVTTAFLTRLQSLLREFDAEIRFIEGDYSPAIIFLGHKDEKTRFGKFIDGVVLYSKHCKLSSDTIMDYDKE